MSAKEEITQQIVTVSQHTRGLLAVAKDTPWRQPQLVMICLQELQLALEELRIAEEELCSQNEALLLTQQALEAERQRYQDLFEFAPDGYIVTDRYGAVREANRAAIELLGVGHRYLIGKPLVNFVPEEQRRAFRSVLNQLPTIQRVQEWEIEMVGRKGTAFDAAVTVEAVRGEQGEAIAFRWLVRDITARKQAEEQLRQVQMQNMQLLEADRLKSQFIATLSHELRTPMNAILGFSELLLRQFQQHHQEPQFNKMVERIFSNGRHLLKLIEEMLDFSRLKAHRLELHLEPFDLAEFAKEIIEELHPLADQKLLDFEVYIAPSNLLIINDPTRLRQVITNLVSNAIKFTEAGSVRVEIQELPEDRVQISVKDTGIGIDPTDQSRIFQEFWQVNQSTTRRYEGTGLGLAIVYALVQLMQGTITVESEPGKGTLFQIELPRWITPQQELPEL